MARYRNLVAAMIALLIPYCPAWAQGRAATRPARPRAAEPVLGQPASDFQLHRMETVKDKDGSERSQVSDRNVRLSSFKGKKPVCLVFSSYT